MHKYKKLSEYYNELGVQAHFFNTFTFTITFFKTKHIFSKFDFFSLLQRCIDAPTFYGLTFYVSIADASTYYALKNRSFLIFKTLLSSHSFALIRNTCENPNRSAKFELITLLVLLL